MGDLWLEDVCNVTLENSWRVSLAHGEHCESEGAKRGIESSHISGVLMELTLVEGDIEVKGSVDRSPGEVFSDNIYIWRHSGIVNCNCIEGF